MKKVYFLCLLLLFLIIPSLCSANAGVRIMKNGKFALEGTAHDNEDYEWQVKVKSSFDILKFRKISLSFKGAIQSVSWGSDKGPGVGLRNVGYNLIPFIKWEFLKNHSAKLFINHWSIHLADLNAVENNAKWNNFNTAGISLRRGGKMLGKKYAVEIGGEWSVARRKDYKYNNAFALEGEVDLFNFNAANIFLKEIFELISTNGNYFTYYRVVAGIKVRTNKKSSVKIFAGTQNEYAFSAKEGLITSGPFVGMSFIF